MPRAGEAELIEIVDVNEGARSRCFASTLKVTVSVAFSVPDIPRHSTSAVMVAVPRTVEPAGAPDTTMPVGSAVAPAKPGGVGAG